MRLDLYKEIEGIDQSKWHPKFRLLMREMEFSRERDIISSWTEGFVDRDKKIIKEFQTTFHSSFWEFYLFALFKDAGFELDQTHARPDFIIKYPTEIYVEAVVANIKDTGKKEDERNLEDYMCMFNPPHKQIDFYEVLNEAIIRHFNAIANKNKRFINGYSKCEWIDSQNPFVIAMSSYDQINYGREYIYPMLALLYGLYYSVESNSFVTRPSIIKKETNATIPLGIFNDINYENISAIIYSCTTTLGKLTSLSISNGNFSTNAVYNLRRDYEDTKIPYKLQIVTREIPEELSDGVFIFHNPNAKNKISVEYFETTSVTQYFVRDGKLISTQNTFPIVARLNIPTLMRSGFEMLIQESLREYNGVSINDFYDIKSPEKIKINFEIECGVFIIFRDIKNERITVINYQRPQLIQDDILLKEANNKFEKMKEEKNNINELMGIYIARSQEEYDSFFDE